MSGKTRRRYVMISAVAERFEIHPQTLRLYEKEGLIHPQRSAGNTRLYDEETLCRLELILTLTRDLGVNLAGVEVVLNMREQLESMQIEMDRLLEIVEREMLDKKRYRSPIRAREVRGRAANGYLIPPGVGPVRLFWRVLTSVDGIGRRPAGPLPGLWGSGVDSRARRRRRERPALSVSARRVGAEAAGALGDSRTLPRQDPSQLQDPARRAGRE